MQFNNGIGQSFPVDIRPPFLHDESLVGPTIQTGPIQSRILQGIENTYIPPATASLYGPIIPHSFRHPTAMQISATHVAPYPPQLIMAPNEHNNNDPYDLTFQQYETELQRRNQQQAELLDITRRARRRALEAQGGAPYSWEPEPPHITDPQQQDYPPINPPITSLLPPTHQRLRTNLRNTLQSYLPPVHTVQHLMLRQFTDVPYLSRYDFSYFVDITRIGTLTFSSAKPNNGLTQLLSHDLTEYWQSDGPAPHGISIQLPIQRRLAYLCLYVDRFADESYTPNQITIKSGLTPFGLEVVQRMELTPPPTGWLVIPLQDFASYLDALEGKVNKNNINNNAKQKQIFLQSHGITAILPSTTQQQQQQQTYNINHNDEDIQRGQPVTDSHRPDDEIAQYTFHTLGVPTSSPLQTSQTQQQQQQSNIDNNNNSNSDNINNNNGNNNNNMTDESTTFFDSSLLLESSRPMHNTTQNTMTDDTDQIVQQHVISPSAQHNNITNNNNNNINNNTNNNTPSSQQQSSSHLPIPPTPINDQAFPFARDAPVMKYRRAFNLSIEIGSSFQLGRDCRIHGLRLFAYREPDDPKTTCQVPRPAVLDKISPDTPINQLVHRLPPLPGLYDDVIIQQLLQEQLPTPNLQNNNNNNHQPVQQQQQHQGVIHTVNRLGRRFGSRIR